MSHEGRRRVVIAGGGITGLAAARYLRQHAPDLELTLVESDDRLGGKIATARMDGFVVEGGPDSFLSSKPRGLGLCQELGLEGRLYSTSGKVRRAYILHHHRLHQLPEGLTGLIPTRLGPMVRTPLISVLGKLRMGLELFIPPRTSGGDESLAAFVSRRLGREAYDRMIEPLMSGIYAGDGGQLSLDATFPNLRKAELQHGGLIRSMLAARKTAPRTEARWPAFLTLEGGLAELVETIVAQLRDVDIRLRTPLARVAHSAPGTGEPAYQLTLGADTALACDAAILATPAFVTADIVEGLDHEVAAALRQIPYVSTATVSLAYPLTDLPQPLDAHGYIIPRSEGRPVLACTWTSTKFLHRAPHGYALIRAFLGRAGQDDVLERTDGELLGMVREELRATLGITADPHMHYIFRWPKAIPQYTLGHLGRVNTVERRLERYPGLFHAGCAYGGIGIPDCIASGEKAAERTLSYLRSYEFTEVTTA